MTQSNVVVTGPIAAEGTYKNIVLKSGLGFEEQTREGYCIYHVKWDYDLGGAIVDIPANVVISMEGGVISNGTLVGHDTQIIYDVPVDKAFVNVELEGTWIDDDDKQDARISELERISGNRAESTMLPTHMGRVTLKPNIAKRSNYWFVYPYTYTQYGTEVTANILVYFNNNKYYLPRSFQDTTPVALTVIAQDIVGELPFSSGANIEDVATALDLQSGQYLSYDPRTKVITMPDSSTVNAWELVNDNWPLKNYTETDANLLTQQMISKPNTIYVIQYDYELATDITVPENCVLEFDGGILKDGVLIGQDTNIIEKPNILDNIILKGNFANKSFNASTFSIISQPWNSDVPQTDKLQQFCNIVKNTTTVKLILDIRGTIIIDDTIKLYNNTKLLGIGEGERDIIKDGVSRYEDYTVIKKIAHNSLNSIDAYFEVEAPSKYVELGNFRLADSYNITTLETLPVREYGIYASNISFSDIHNVNIYNVKTGIDIGIGYLTKFTHLNLVKINRGIRNRVNSTSLFFDTVIFQYIYSYSVDSTNYPGFGYYLSNLIYSNIINGGCESALKGSFIRCYNVNSLNVIGQGVEANNLQYNFHLESSIVNILGGDYACSRFSVEENSTIYHYESVCFVNLYRGFVNCIGARLGSGYRIQYAWPLVIDQKIPDSEAKSPNVVFQNCKINGIFPNSSLQYNTIGASSSRPIPCVLKAGFRFYDTDLKQAVYWDNDKGWLNNNGSTAAKLYGTTSQRPLGAWTKRTASSLPTNIGSIIYDGFTILNTSDNKYYIAIHTDSTTINWVLEDTYARKTIPSDVVREGTLQQRPDDVYCNEYLYVGFEYRNNVNGKWYYIHSMAHSGSYYEVVWCERSYNKNVLSSADIGYEYVDKQLFKSIYLYDYDNDGRTKWCDGNGVDIEINKVGTTEERPKGRPIGRLDRTRNIGFKYFDTTLGKPVYVSSISDAGSVTWVDATGTQV